MDAPVIQINQFAASVWNLLLPVMEIQVTFFNHLCCKHPLVHHAQVDSKKKYKKKNSKVSSSKVNDQQTIKYVFSLVQEYD